MALARWQHKSGSSALTETVTTYSTTLHHLGKQTRSQPKRGRHEARLQLSAWLNGSTAASHTGKNTQISKHVWEDGTENERKK